MLTDVFHLVVSNISYPFTKLNIAGERNPLDSSPVSQKQQKQTASAGKCRLFHDAVMVRKHCLAGL